MTQLTGLLRPSLRLKLILAVAVVQAGLVALFVGNLTLRQEAMLLERQVAEAQTTAATVAISVSGWVAANDLAGLQEIVAAQQRDPEIEFAMVLDTQGRVLAHTDRARIGQFVRDLPPDFNLTVLNRSAALVDVASPVTVADRPLGWVRVGMSQRGAQAEIGRITRNGVLYALVAIVLGTIIATYVGARLTRRIYAIRAVSQAVRSGNRTARVRSVAKDEVGQLAADFNDMLDGLHQKEQEIEHLNADLEQRVTARTKELTEAMELNHKLIETASLGILVFAAEGQCELANAAAARVIGGSVAQLQGQNFRQIASWVKSGLRAGAEQVLATGLPQRLEINIVTTFQRDLVLNCALSRFEARGRCHLLLTFTDITEQKRGEALRAQHSAIIESTSDFVATASVTGKVLYYNRTARRLFGLGEKDDPAGYSIEKSHPAWAAKLVLEQGLPTAMRDGIWTGETAFLAHDGREIPYHQIILAHQAPDGAVELFSTVARDISEAKQDAALLLARLRLLEAGARTNLDEFLPLALDEIEAQTGSTIGFFHFMDADQETLTLQAWSTNTVQHVCTAEGKGQHYAVSKAGVWVDCVRERRPVIHNDYPALAHKQGLPPGHSPIQREMVIPILRQDRIVAIIGVGNKPTPYAPAQIEVAQLLGDFVWEIVERKRTEAALRASEGRFKTMVAGVKDYAIIMLDAAGRVASWNAGAERLQGYRAEEIIGQHFSCFHLPEAVASGQPEQELQLATTAGRCEAEGERVRKDGSRFIADVVTTPLHDEAGQLCGFSKIMRDITARKQTEAALLQSNARFQKLFESSPDPTWIIEGSCFAECNQAAISLLGYPGKSQLLNTHPSKLSPPTQPDGESSHDKADRMIAEAKAKGLHRFEWIHQKADGTVFPTEVTLCVIELESRPAIYCAWRDISDRKQAEAALLESEQRIRLAVEATKVGIWEWNLKANSILWDAEMFRIYGLTPSADGLVQYRDWQAAVFPEELAAQERALQAVVQQRGQGAREFRIRRRDSGEIRHIQAFETVRLNAAGEVGYVVGTNLDITERKQVEAALAHSQQLLRLVMDTIPMGVFWKDRAGRYLGCNQHAARDAGLPHPAAVVGLTDFDLAWKLSAAAYQADDQEVMASGRAKTDIDEQMVQADGRVQWLRTNKLPLRDASGAVFGVLGTYEDISGRKELELEQAKLLAELARSNTDLEQFAYVASHDLKAPLRAIDSLAGWLEEDIGPTLAGDNRKHLSLLRQRTKRMERLLDDLLAYSRVGRVPADMAPVTIPRLVAEIVELLSPKPGFTVQLGAMPTGITSFTTAVTPLRQVLFNLIANALKHHDRASGVIEVSAQASGGMIEFAVADDGPGIAPEFHQRIFGMFQTLRPRDDIEGSGMGLALVERITMRFGGKVTVACRQPRGVIFRFTWPKQIQEATKG